MEEIIVVLAADNKYAIPLTVTLYSLLSHLHSEQPIVLYVIDGGIKWWNKIKIKVSLSKAHNNFKLEWLKPSLLENQINTLKFSGHLSAKAVYFRLLIPYLLDEKIDKVIYLDSDLLIQKDLTQLWNIDIQDKDILAVQDTGIPYVSSPNGLIKYKEFGLKENDKYFNSGVLVINLDKWRSDNLSEEVIKFTQTNRESIRWADQDGLNAILVNKWGQLDPRWNQVSAIHKYSCWEESPFTEEVYNNSLNDPYIIHFSSQIKPWHFKVTYKCPYEDLFFEYLDRTAWKGWRPKEGLKIRLRRYWQKVADKFKELSTK
ncbi:MAG: glycosyltransferase family 8 protein [Cyanobacteriota bacterium]|nr:glycosyltransferase family 8 protein [Cyanobacteriota bacterium]